MTELRQRNEVLIGVMDLATKVLTIENSTTKAESSTLGNSKIGLTKEKLEEIRLDQSKSNVNLRHENSMGSK